MFKSTHILRTFDQETTSQIALRDCSKEVREEPGYMGFWEKKTKDKNQVVGTKMLPLIKKKQTSQVNEFSTFLCMGRHKNLDSLK